MVAERISGITILVGKGVAGKLKTEWLIFVAGLIFQGVVQGWTMVGCRHFNRKHGRYAGTSLIGGTQLDPQRTHIRRCGRAAEGLACTIKIEPAAAQRFTIGQGGGNTQQIASITILEGVGWQTKRKGFGDFSPLFADGIKQNRGIIAVGHFNIKGGEHLFANAVNRLNLDPKRANMAIIRCAAEGLGIAIKMQPLRQGSVAADRTGGQGKLVTPSGHIFIGKDRGGINVKTEQLIFGGNLVIHRVGQSWRMVNMGDG